MADPLEVVATITAQPHGWVILKMTKAIVVLSREEFKLGLQRGKWWQRHGQLQLRLGTEGATAATARREV